MCAFRFQTWLFVEGGWSEMDDEDITGQGETCSYGTDFDSQIYIVALEGKGKMINWQRKTTHKKETKIEK